MPELRLNPAAVFVLDDAPTEDWMAMLAGEMNLSETAFVIREKLLTGFQVSARSGLVGVEPRGDRVLVSGQAVTVLDGVLNG